MEMNELTDAVIGCAMDIHREVGPGLLESAYEAVLCHRLTKIGVAVERQRLVPIVVDGLTIEQGFRADVIIDGRLLLEIKSIDRLLPVHSKQVLTYLRLLDLRVGLLMNFGGDTLKEGLKRIVNNFVAD